MYRRKEINRQCISGIQWPDSLRSLVCGRACEAVNDPDPMFVELLRGGVFSASALGICERVSREATVFVFKAGYAVAYSRAST